MKQLRLMPTILVKYFLRGLHGFFSFLFKVNRKKITFASYRSNHLRDNLFYVSEEIKKNYSSYKIVYLLKKFDSSGFGKINYLIHMVKACFHLATSRYFIIDDYYFPIYVIKPRKDMDIIQLWHSSGAFKKFGLSTVGKSFGPSTTYLKQVNIHGNYSKTYVSSKEVIPYFAEAFGMAHDQIKPLGVPRTDFFYKQEWKDKTTRKFYKKYPLLKEKKIILYAPTFRGKSHYQEAFQIPFDTWDMRSRLQDNHALLVHLHPYMRTDRKIEADGFVYHLDNAFTIQELLVLTDILITDYSTVFFDFSLLDRPIIFYPYDLKDYKQDRDFYYDYEEMIPGPMVVDTESLIKTILGDESYDQYDKKQFANRFFDYQDGKATERIVADIFEG
ncbi:CDP-glycerol glycerophosphotransferase family protein [Paucisalibacillus sp. EB02]|uniref:CDP-glycerol glycerophosphotransferase family protein n=1 Tax=Paucisalibacillus sp. EB02 TaxID=1347087 RepID=UPI0004B1DD81|nr:CDP-glycerol glycerophosphotransferase family protein [Paucisalibacillus sp. EB02]